MSEKTADPPLKPEKPDIVVFREGTDPTRARLSPEEKRRQNRIFITAWMVLGVAFAVFGWVAYAVLLVWML